MFLHLLGARQALANALSAGPNPLAPALTDARPPAAATLTDRRHSSENVVCGYEADQRKPNHNFTRPPNLPRQTIHGVSPVLLVD